MPILLEDGSGALVQEDGSAFLGETGASPGQPVTGSGAILSDGGLLAGTGRQTDPATTGLKGVTLTGAAVIGGQRGTTSAMTLVSQTLTNPRFMALSTLVGYVLLGPPPEKIYYPSRPEPARAPGETVVRKQIQTPIKRLPQPTDRYDREYQQQMNEAVIKHLDNTMSISTPNPHVMLASPGGKIFKIEVGEDGSIKATPQRS